MEHCGPSKRAFFSTDYMYCRGCVYFGEIRFIPTPKRRGKGDSLGRCRSSGSCIHRGVEKNYLSRQARHVSSDCMKKWSSSVKFGIDQPETETRDRIPLHQMEPVLAEPGALHVTVALTNAGLAHPRVQMDHSVRVLRPRPSIVEIAPCADSSERELKCTKAGFTLLHDVQP